MRLTEIETLPTDPNMPAETQQVRKQAPLYIRSVVEETYAVPEIGSIEELRPEQIDTLGGGVDAATYLITSPKFRAIIKFSHAGLDAEAEALRAWKKRHVRVPKVIASGIVPATKRQKRPIKYLLQQALLDKHGRVVETCASHLTHSPNQARKVGRLLGVELAKLHSAVSERSFGDFADSSGKTAAYASWNGYMLGYLEAQLSTLKALGVSEKEILALRRFIEKHRFIKQGRYLHGDFSIRNAAIKSHDPLEVSLFDPNPIIGDPTWDIAVLFNNYEFQKRRLHHDDGSQRDLYVRDQQLLTGFKQGYKRKINQGSLLVAQLMQGLLQYQYLSNSSKNDKVGVRARRDFVLDTVGAIISSEAK